MLQLSLVGLISGILSVFAISLSIFILNKVFEEKYKRPWLFIGVSALCFSLGQFFKFFFSFFKVDVVSLFVIEIFTTISEFLAIATLTYGLLLETLILKYYKGRFIKTKFIPVQEGTLGGKINLNVIQGESYLAHKKENSFIYDEYSGALKKGFEGFIISEESPKYLRESYSLERTPMAWVTQIEQTSSPYTNEILDKNSDIIDPLRINDLISYIDSFLEQAEHPFLLLELDLFGKVNTFEILVEFLKYITSRIKRCNGILICLVRTDVFREEQIGEMLKFLYKLE